MNRRYERIDKCIEYGIYVYVFLMFLAKGEGIKNIIIFGGFALWLFTLKQRNTLSLLKSPVSIFCWFYVGATILSAAFSIDPLFSLKELKGEMLKFSLLYPVIATSMTDENRLKKTAFVAFLSLLVIALAGYYSYIFHDLPMMKPDTALVHAWHTKFARYLCTLMPLSFVLYFVWDKGWQKGLIVISLLLSLIALVLSTARGGYIAFASIALLWLIYLSRTKRYDLRKIAGSAIIIAGFAGIAAFVFFPHSLDRLSHTGEEIFTLNKRTALWEQAYYAFVQRPVTGWGYGDRLFLEDEPYRNTPYGAAPQKEKGTHNMFMKVLFHQGIIGLVSYVLVVVSATVLFWKNSLRSGGFRGYYLAACASVLLGNYIVNSLLEDVVRLQYLAVVLGLGMAALCMEKGSTAGRLPLCEDIHHPSGNTEKLSSRPQ
jgi:O-antigen ligase